MTPWRLPIPRAWRPAGAGVLVAAWILLLLIPIWRGMLEAGSARQALARQLREARQGIAELPQLIQREQALRDALRAIPRPLVQERVPALLDEVAAVARAQGLTVEMVRPPTTPPAKKGRQQAPSAETATEYAIIPVEILGWAGYHDVGRFLAALETAPPMYRVRTLVMEADRRSPERARVAVTVEASVAVSPL